MSEQTVVNKKVSVRVHHLVLDPPDRREMSASRR